MVTGNGCFGFCPHDVGLILILHEESLMEVSAIIFMALV